MAASLVLACVIAFLLGSIPFGLVLVRIFRGTDIRKSGSGNIGTANVARVAPALGLWTLILDAAKGYVAVLIGKGIAVHFLTGSDSTYIPVVLGGSALFSVLGHVFSIFLKFKGGKGVATALGAFLALMPWAVLIVAALYLVIYAVWHYTSLASITCAAVFPIAAAVLMKPADRPLLLPFLIAISLLIIVKHRENIRRLLAGTENRLELKRR